MKTMRLVVLPLVWGVRSFFSSVVGKHHRDTFGTMTTDNDEALQRYYDLHAGIYDATRWSFLFGREAAVRMLGTAGTPKRILEIGCGTGRNLASICREFPEAHVTGVDVSAAMIQKATPKVLPHINRVRLLQQAYDKPVHPDGEPFDAVLCSYSLTMFNPGWETAIEAAYNDLAPGGLMVVCDFHDWHFRFFKRWLGVSRVRVDGHLRPVLRSTFKAVVDETPSAYGRVWQYLLFAGIKE